MQCGTALQKILFQYITMLFQSHERFIAVPLPTSHSAMACLTFQIALGLHAALPYNSTTIIKTDPSFETLNEEPYGL